MKLTRLAVTNYRGLRDVEIPLSRFVCITGENNSGKSSVLQAFSLFLSGSTLQASNFFDSAKEITIAVTLSDISDEDLSLLVEEHRDRIAPLLTDRSLILVRRYSTDGKSQLGYIGLVPKEPRFGMEFIGTLVSGKRGAALRDAVVAQFPELEGQITATTTQTSAKERVQQLADSLPPEAKESRFLPLPTGVDKSVIPMLPERIYIPAVKDLSDDTKTAESSPFGKILAIIMKAIEPKLVEEQDLFEKLSRKLTRVVRSDGTVEDNRLEEIRRIERTIENFVRESFANVALKIEIPPPEIRTLLSTARILANDGVEGPLELKGDGLRRAVVFSILRTYVEFAREAATEIEEPQTARRSYLLLFEEPELFLHPDAQRILFDALSVVSKDHHVVVTTHSPLFLGPDSTATFVRLTKESTEGTSKPFTKAHPVDLTGIRPKDEFQIICFENNNAAFFAKKIVLVEGDSDLIVFPHIAETLDTAWTSRAQSVAFVRISGKGSIARYRGFFARFGSPVFIITDLDALDDGFSKLEAGEAAKVLRDDLIYKVDAATAAAGLVEAVDTDCIRDAQVNPEVRRLWDSPLCQYG